jgi:hypothetical protein
MTQSTRLQKDPEMRFHKFPRLNGKDVLIDLDKITSLRSGEDVALKDGTVVSRLSRTTRIYLEGTSWAVDMPIDDVLALISPPAAPDTFEEDLARWMAAKKGSPPLGSASGRAQAVREGIEAEAKLRQEGSGSICEGLEDRPMTAEDMPPYNCPECGVREGYLHDSGCSLNLRRHTVEQTRVMHARIDELERTAKIFCGQVEAYWPTWAKHIIEQRRAEITGITLTDV